MRSIPLNDHRNFNEASTWVPLFEITLAPGDVQYLTPCPTPVTVDGHTYQPFPIMLEELRDDGKGEIATVRLVVSNVEGLLGTRIKQSSSGLDGQPIAFKIYSVEQDLVVYEETLEISKVGPITTQSIVFELGMFNPFTVRLLQEKFLRDFCWNRYKGNGCWVRRSNGSFAQPALFVAGDPDSCGKHLEDCDRHNNVLRFNSFPGIPGGGAFV
jgi:phage-related protein